MTGIIIIVTLVIGYYAFKKYSSNNYLQTVLEIMKSHNNFNPNYYQVMANNSGAIALDTNQRLLCIINENRHPFYLNRENIFNTEILVDQQSYHQKNFLRTWGKYFLLKSIGSESTAEASVHIARGKHINKIKTLKLKIGTSSLNTPNLYLLFSKNGTENHKRKIINEVYDWITRIESIKTN